jgi:hypothetical protein
MAPAIAIVLCSYRSSLQSAERFGPHVMRRGRGTDPDDHDPLGYSDGSGNGVCHGSVDATGRNGHL